MTLAFVFACSKSELFVMVLRAMCAVDTANLESVCVFYKGLATAKACHDVITQFCDEILGCGGELHTKAEAVANAKLLKNFGRIA